MRQEKKTGGTKRALLTSVLAIVLCLVMLMGSTFAWFTDTASTGVNSIVSGTLDVGLSYWTGTEWADAENSEDLFDKTALWEPGYTQIVYLKVKNNGNLALNYAMQITPVHETVGVNVNGDEFKLSDYIQFGWAEIAAAEDGTFTPFADRAAARTAVGTGVHLGETLRRQAEQPLNAGGETLVALVAWMPEEVGNVANYRDVAPSIELTLKVLATQATVESDSYNNLYDEAATEDELVNKPTYDYSNNELDGIILIPDENGNIVKAIVTGKAGKVPEAYFNNEKFANLKEVVIQEGVTEIEKGAFQGCKALKTVTLTEGLQKIGESAFAQCYNLNTINVPESVEVIGNNAFRACSALTDVHIPEGVTEIGDTTFAYAGLKELKLPSTVTTIGKSAFQNCQFTRIDVPETVVNIGYRAFASCMSATEVTINSPNLDGQIFYNCQKMVRIIFKDNVEKIPLNTFPYCVELTTIYAKQGVWAVNGVEYTVGEDGLLPGEAVTAIKASKVATYVPTP